MKCYVTSSLKNTIYQNKYLINKGYFLFGGGYCLAFHRRAGSDRLKMNLKTLADRHGAYSGVFL